MRRMLHTAAIIAWGLWVGGLMMLFLALQSLFKTFATRHDLAGEAAAGIFKVFNVYHLALAAAVLLLTFAWWLAERTGRKVLAFTCFAVAAVAASYVTAVLTPRMENLRLDHLTNTSEFARLHGISMAVYMAEAIFVFLGGMSLQWATRAASGSILPARPALQL